MATPRARRYGLARPVFLVGLVLFPVLMAAGQNQDVPYPRFSAEAGTFFTAGTADEIVYSGSGSQSKTSELLWPVPISPGVWTSFRVDWISWLSNELRLQAAIPIVTGTMTDDDWNIEDSNGNLLSRVHSDSTAYLKADWRLRFETIVPFQEDGFHWKLLAGVDYQHLAWEAWNATQTETFASDGSKSTISLTGMGVSFEQNWILLYLGGGIGTTWQGVEWNLDLRASPYPIDVQTDEHVIRGLTFNETLGGGFSVAPDLSAAWPLSPTLKMRVDFEYQGSFYLRGDEVVSVDGATSGTSNAGFFSYSDGAGAGFQGFSFGLGVVASL